MSGSVVCKFYPRDVVYTIYAELTTQPWYNKILQKPPSRHLKPFKLDLQIGNQTEIFSPPSPTTPPLSAVCCLQELTAVRTTAVHTKGSSKAALEES
jgi:hypothetical protein